MERLKIKENIQQDENTMFEIIECPQCHWATKIAKGTCSRCSRCGEKIGSCDE